MSRTYIHLTQSKCDELAALANATGKTQNELIREAIDAMLERYSASRRRAILDAAAGMWKDRKDLPDFRALRSEWDRGEHNE
jgi:hypothetical protein